MYLLREIAVSPLNHHYDVILKCLYIYNMDPNSFLSILGPLQGMYIYTGNVWIHTVKIKYVFVNGTPNNGPHKILDLSLGSHLIANLAAL